MTKTKVIVQSKRNYRISRTFRAKMKLQATEALHTKNMIMGDLVQAVQQKSHTELLTPVQLEEAKKMGITKLKSSNSQYDLLKLVKFQKDKSRRTDKCTRHLLKQHGRKDSKLILQKRFENSLS